MTVDSLFDLAAFVIRQQFFLQNLKLENQLKNLSNEILEKINTLPIKRPYLIYYPEHHLDNPSFIQISYDPPVSAKKIPLPLRFNGYLTFSAYAGQDQDGFCYHHVSLGLELSFYVQYRFVPSITSTQICKP